MSTAIVETLISGTILQTWGTRIPQKNNCFYMGTRNIPDKPGAYCVARKKGKFKTN